MKSEQQTLHFAFGPVQDFVSQARRTRDLWAGSYLLSWLAGHAMSALLNKGGEIKMPDVKGDALLQQICHPQEIDLDHTASHLGPLPNRFTALVPDGVDGTVCTEAIKTGNG
ncbi:MAG: type III-B CRISPR-associated protein Cas10/Cmr2, partial [Candidatus Electrothrix sp. AR4]|nr:type III-B CRISPR-associated protein Cas10/Cmr2 [Candidatus Electrothrix sp. AR4]